jgi:hypothetical protein
MTLAGVASRVRYEIENVAPKAKTLIESIVRRFEEDPEFKLPERVDSMIADLERNYLPGLDRPTAKEIANRMREDLGRGSR